MKALRLLLLGAVALILLCALTLAVGSDGLPVSAAPPHDNPVERAREHLKQNNSRYGLSSDLTDLSTDGLKESSAGEHVRFQQTVDGTPVEGATVSVTLPRGDAGAAPVVTNAYVANPRIEGSRTARISGQVAAVLAEASISAGPKVARGTPSSKLVYYPTGASYTLAWRVEVPLSEPLGDWVVYVRADSGVVLWTGNLLQFDDGRVFDPNPLQDSVCQQIGSCPIATNCNNPGDATALTGADPTVATTQGWSFVRTFLGVQVAQNKLVGQFADATAFGGGMADSAAHQFRYGCDTAAFLEAMAYYHVDQAQRKVQGLPLNGINGILNYSFPVEAADLGTDCNAFYSPAPLIADRAIHLGTSDGTCPSAAEDADVIVHEYGHAIQDAVVNPFHNCGPGPGVPRNNTSWPSFECLQAWSIGEGFGDFFAAVRFSSPCIGEWFNLGTSACNGDTRPGLRTLVNNVRFVPANGVQNLPGSCANVYDEHCLGLIWGGALWDMATAIGWNELALRIVLESHFLLGQDPSFAESVAAVCNADVLLTGGVFGPVIENAFNLRGLPLCSSDADDDAPPDNGDGYTASAESGTPLCGNAKNDDDRVNNPGNPFPAALAADDAVIDDGCPGGPPMAGTYSEADFKIGTSATGRCGMGIEAGPSAQWPSDFVSGGLPNSTDKVNVTDLASFIAPPALRRLDTAPGNPVFSSRWDLSPGRGVFTNIVNVTDLVSSIAPTTKGYPPMLWPNSVTPLTTRAFNGPACTD